VNRIFEFSPLPFVGVNLPHPGHLLAIAGDDEFQGCALAL
jgi:hypothetical protein